LDNWNSRPAMSAEAHADALDAARRRQEDQRAP
jgi:hypothetical protein